MINFSKLMMEKDKANHFAWAALSSSAAFIIFNSVLVSFVLTLAVIVAKEIYDKVSKKGTPSALDIVYSLFGVVPVLGPLVWIK